MEDKETLYIRHLWYLWHLLILFAFITLWYDHVKVDNDTKNQQTVPSVNTNLLKEKCLKSCSEIIKVHQRTRKIRSSGAMSVNRNVLKGIL